MPQYGPTTADDARALATLDVHYAMLLGCTPGDLRRSGWTVISASAESDPSTLLFGQRPLLRLISPSAPDAPDAPAGARGGVVGVVPELRPHVAALLRTRTPGELFTDEGLGALDALVREVKPALVTQPGEAHTRLRYATEAGLRAYAGPLQEWIEPLDEGAEMEPQALGLLARFAGGVYVIRQRDTIAAYAGIRPLSPHICELSVRTDVVELRGKGLGRAVASRATRAVLASRRVPLYRHAARDAAAERVADVLGYRPYGDMIAYFAQAH